MTRNWTQRQQAHDHETAERLLLWAAAATRLLFWVSVAVAALLAIWAVPASALPCLSKAQALKQADSAGYRTVNGQRCWYVVDYVPDKAEFVQPKKRKEVVRRVHRSPVVSRPDKTTPAVARAQAQPPQALPADIPVDDGPSGEWLAADRSQAIEALCGNPCRVGGAAPTARVRDAFDGLMALIAFDRRSATTWRAALVGP